jgi:metal-dependent amidase/aminoacylase/carboxypeptidase family protein
MAITQVLGPIDERVALRSRATAWRGEPDTYPEIAFGERRTASLVALQLRSCDIEVWESTAGIDVFGTLRCGSGVPTYAAGAVVGADKIDQRPRPCGVRIWTTLAERLVPVDLRTSP